MTKQNVAESLKLNEFVFPTRLFHG
uniref:Uncharacterized protein n=1 Tax=Arundo donax TaxID=35708 RepID=A0A0A8Y5A7_ARUDO